MSKSKRSWDLLTEAERKSAINEIIRFYSNERGEEIGIIAAESLLDMFLEVAATQLYNKGVEDTREFVKTKLGELEMDIEVAVKK